MRIRQLPLLLLVSIAVASSAMAQVPTAICTGVRNNAPNAADFRFNFGQKLYDPLNSVTVGTDWRYKAPIYGIYHVDAQFTVSYPPSLGDQRFPYVACRAFILPVSQTTPTLVTQSYGFNVNCGVSTDLILKKDELLYFDIGQASGSPKNITGRFSIHFVRPY